jgi:hypothetical protein
MTINRRFPHSVLALSIVLSLAVTNSALSPKRARAIKRTPARIVFDKSDVQLGPNQTVEVKAQVLDANNKPIINAKIEWTPPGGAQSAIVVRPVDKAGTDVLITTQGGNSPTASVTLHAQSGRASGDLTIHLQDVAPAEIVFPDGSKVDLLVRGTQTIRAYVLDANGNRIPTADVIWNLADPDHEAFVLVGQNVNKAGVNSVNISWLAGKADLKTPTEVKLVARSGSKARGIITIAYKATKAEVTTISLDPGALMLGPGDSKTVKATVLGEDKRVLKNDVKAEIADQDARKYITVVVDNQTITVLGSDGDPKSSPPPLLRTALIVSTDTSAATIPVIYQRDPASIDWTIVPPRIVGDNYGRTIMKDYYCIEVTIQNNSGSDLALAGLRFVTGKGEMQVGRPNTSYAIVHGSLARRKLTHPRTMTLAIIDGLGSLMTGFNPFFHNVNHAKNFSQFIDILSNPLAKGLDKAWKDAYPDELARLEQDVLHDDKIIPNASTFKTRIFVPKRSLFTNNENNDKKDRENLVKVREKLGTLWVMGYKFQKGPILGMGSQK